MPEKKPSYLNISELKIGHYVHLDIGWMNHSFTFNSFQIRTKQELEEVRSLGLSKIRYEPDKSDVKEDSKSTVVIEPQAAEPVIDEAELARKNEVLKKRQERISFTQKLRSKLVACEKEYVKAGSTVRDIMKNMFSSPTEVSESANKLVTELGDTLAAQEDVAIYLMSGKGVTGKEVYLHSVSVSALGMMIAKAMKLDTEVIHSIGMGGVFHDIGQADIPGKILLKTEPLTSFEESIFQQHCQFGVNAAVKLKLSDDVKKIIAQHHEYIDGSGYPAGLKGNQISLGARVIGVVNAYDNLCNPHNSKETIVPYKVLSTMFAKMKDKFDSDVLKTLVRTLGVYPPGTIVKLSNDMIAMVIGVNTRNSLQPQIKIYDSGIPVAEAISLDLEQEPDISIVSAINPTELTDEIIEYLNPRKRVKYYIDAPK